MQTETQTETAPDLGAPVESAHAGETTPVSLDHLPQFSPGDDYEHIAAKPFTAEWLEQANLPPEQRPGSALALPAAASMDTAAIVGDFFEDTGDTTEFLGRLYDRSPERYTAMVDAILTHHGDHFRQQLGIGIPSWIQADVLNTLPAEYRPGATMLSREVWESLEYLPDEAVTQILEGARELHELRQANGGAAPRPDLVPTEASKMRQDYQRRQMERVQAEDRALRESAGKSFALYADTLRREGISRIAENWSGKVKFSSDKTQAALQKGAAAAIVANLLNPDLRFAAQEALQALGIEIDSKFDETLTALNDHASTYVAQKTIAENPGTAKWANEATMRAAQAEAKRLYDMAIAKLNGVGLKVAKTLAGSDPQMDDFKQSPEYQAYLQRLEAESKSPQERANELMETYGWRTKKSQQAKN